MALSPRQLFTSLQIVLRFLLFLTPRRRPPTSPSTRLTSDRRIPRLPATFLTASPFDARSLHFTFVSETFHYLTTLSYVILRPHLTFIYSQANAEHVYLCDPSASPNVL